MSISDSIGKPLLPNEIVGGGTQVEENILYVNNLSYIPSRTLGNVLSNKILEVFPKWEFPFWQRLTTDYMRPMLQRSSAPRNSVSLLRSISFSARQGEITAVLSSEYGERRTLIDLIVGRRKRGVFAGDINLHGRMSGDTNTSLAMNSALVPRKTLFCPGMTYEKMLHYSARLRMSILPDGRWQAVSDVTLERRVHEVLKLMNLWKVRHDVLPEDTPERGEVAGALRRLSIAIEVIHYPPLVVIDDPVLGLEPAVAFTIMQALQNLARRGHIVILAMPAPSPQILAKIDRLVVIGKGLTIYSSPPQEMKEFFCSPDVGYELKRGVDLMDWMRDIATGVERPINHRGNHELHELQEKFECSTFFEGQLSKGDTSDSISSFHPKLFKYWGYGQFNSFQVHMHQIYLVTSRALHAKLLEKDALRRSIGGSCLVGLLLGGLNYGVGHYGNYTMMLVKFPYVNTSNMTAMMFFMGAFIFAQQVMTVQILCRKVSLFRQEQAAGYCGMGTFAFSTLLSEAPVSSAMALIFGSIAYFMTDLNYGLENYLFFSLDVMSLAIIGLQTAFLLAVALRREIIVRDLFLIITFLQVLLSGFPFQLTAIAPIFKTISKINPMRWNFEAFMNFKFGQNYEDGEAYCEPFGMANYEWEHTLGYYHTFMFVGFSLSLFFMLSKPNLLRRKANDPMYRKGHGNQQNSNRVMAWCIRMGSCCGLLYDVDNDDDDLRGRASSLDPVEKAMWLSDADAGMDAASRRGDKSGSRSGSLSEAVGLGGSNHSASTLGEINKNKNSVVEPAAFQRIRTAELAKPLLYHRESSVTGAGGSRLSQQISKDGTRNQFGTGPTVAFRHVTHKESDRSKTGFKYSLENVSGQFDWGKLSCIMGAPGAGKSTLLRVIAGDINHKANVTGYITYDQTTPDINLPLWQRCALVGKDDALYPSLTVYEVITYAMELRCVSKLALELVEENVMKTLDVLHLNDVMDKPVNKLNAGERRRLSIAEEIVCGPTLLLIDEPTTNLDPLAESVLLRTFREMVNESRTVVATLHQPSAVVFDLFDTLLLLSKGQVIYHGPAADAVKYFVAQPLNFPFADYSNPADFLTDVSAGAVVDNKKSKANPFTLAKEWRKTDKYIALMKRLNPETFIAGGTGNNSKANSKAGTAKTSANNSVQPLRITEKSGSLSSPVRRLNTNGSETTDDGGDVFPNADGAMDGDSGRLTFSRSTNSYGGMQKHTIALEQAAGSNGEPLRKSDGAAMQYNQLHTGASGSLATVLSDEDDVKTLEMQRKAEYDNKALVTGSFARIWGIVCDIIGSFFFTVISGTASFFTNSEYRTILFMRMYVLLKRSAVGLWKRKQLFFGSFFVLIFIALLLGTVLGNSQESIYNTISFFAVGPLLIMLSNVQMISYLFATHQVFYKDHSRGIYSNFTYWLVSSIPLYLLRMLSAFCAAPILYAMLELEAPAGSTFADTQGYYILMTVLGTVASTMIIEFLIYIAPTIRAAYLMVPALSFGQFMFCGLFLKPQLLPAWMQQWAPSISLFRWTLQGCFLNQFEGNDTLFPPIGNMSTFDAFTSLYGWGNQNKWYCMYMVVAVIGVIRLITLLATSFVSRVRKGN